MTSVYRLTWKYITKSFKFEIITEYIIKSLKQKEVRYDTATT